MHKWEFVNEHFKRGQKELLSEIKRLKTVPQSSTHPPDAGKHGADENSLSNPGGDDTGSTSTSSSSFKYQGSVETNTTPSHQLSSENKKLKKDTFLAPPSSTHFSSNGSWQESRIYTKKLVSMDQKSWLHGAGLVCLHGDIKGKN